jgi:hypothetical protein
LRVFKNRSFDRFARKAAISDASLCNAVALIEKGRFDADLGQGVYKQRIARAGQGKSGGFRVIVVVRIATIAVFLHGFAKNDVANLTLGEVKELKKLARYLLELDTVQWVRELSAGLLMEVDCNGQTLSQPGDGIDS